MYLIGEIFGGIIVKQVRLTTKNTAYSLEEHKEFLKLASIRPLLVPFTGNGHGRHH